MVDELEICIAVEELIKKVNEYIKVNSATTDYEEITEDIIPFYKLVTNLSEFYFKVCKD